MSRVGVGYDIHALKAGRRLVLGGIEIPSKKGLLGHSDGDVVLHAIVDAVLGALGEGDIGEHFPDKNKRYQAASSLLFVKKVKEILKKKSFKIGNVDSTIIAETPNLSGYKKKMVEKIAKGFGILETQVGVKAKTNEGFGAIGKGQAIACISIVSLKKLKI